MKRIDDAREPAHEARDEQEERRRDHASRTRITPQFPGR